MAGKKRIKKRRAVGAYPKFGVEVKKSDLHGLGVFTTKPFKKRSVVCVFTGDPLSKRAKGDSHTLFLGENDGGISAIHVYPPFRYVNHSTNPNTEYVDDHGVPKLRALRAIRKGEEITFHYGEGWENV